MTLTWRAAIPGDCLRGVILLVMASLLSCLAYFWWMRDGAYLLVDSASYLEFWPLRTAGYPAFLQLLTGLGLSLPLVRTVQLGLLTTSICALALETWWITGRTWIGLLATLALWCVPPLIQFEMQIASEAVFVPVQILMMAFVLRLIRTRRIINFAWLCLWVGVSAAVRPVGMTFLLLPPLLLIWLGRGAGWCRVSLMTGLGIAVLMCVFFAEAAYYTSVNGPHRSSLTGLHLFAKSAMVEPSSPIPVTELALLSPAEKVLAQSADAGAADIRAVAWTDASVGVREYVINAYEGYLQYSYRRDLRTQLIMEGRCESRWCTESLKKIGLLRLRHAAPDYAKLTALHYLGMWLIYGVRTPDGAAELASFIARHQPMPLLSEIVPFNQPEGPLFYAPLARWVVGGFGVLTFLSAFWLIGSLCIWRTCPRNLAIAGIAGMLVHGNFLAVALMGTSLTRYTVAMWPLMAVSMGFLVLEVASRLGRCTDERLDPIGPGAG